MELFKILTIVFFLGIIFGSIPLWIWFIQKRENTNRIKKVNIKTGLIIYYVMMSVSVVGFGVFLFLDNKYDIIKSKPKIYEIPSTKIETQEEWFQTKSGAKYTYNENNLQKNNNKSWLLTDIAQEGVPMIKRTYTFYGLNGLGRGHHREHEPADLALFVKNPFDKWYDEGMRVDEFDGFHTKYKDKNSQFDGGNGVSINPLNHTIYINYKGPKHLLEEDKDFFMDEVNCTSNERSPEGVLKSKTYYLHFNPKQAYITLYTQKHNIK
ncbi:MAG: hypothetical protein QS2022_4190 [Candidatus Phytoplasma asteris]|nr:MAG: hypothetical protein PLY_4140 [Periwinkle leaf yellowing phytoplasma]WEX19667.1 MAG: hypothetical protein QS2022_4190 [Candidatus Phytoplasma asteris]